jgi:hypothetical protein
MIVILVRRDTVAGPRAQQELLATCAAFCLPLSIVFIGSAALQLCESTDDNSLLAMLPSTGIENVFIDEHAASIIAGRTTSLPYQALADDAIRALLQRAQHTLVV